ncbi:MAG: RNA polymerase sigma factor [Chloroflexota bacterium]
MRARDPSEANSLDFDELDDEALVRLIQNECQAQKAFTILYRRHITMVFRYLVARVETEEDAQDLTSQTFMAALEALSKFEGRAKFTTWLIGIARNKATDHLRRQRNTLSLDVAQTIPYPTPHLDEIVEQNLKLDLIIRTMRVLSPDRAEALTLHSFAGLSATQVAEIMDKKEPAVRMLIHRAIRDIRKRLNINIQESVS